MSALGLATFIFTILVSIFHLWVCLGQYKKNGNECQSKFLADCSKPMLMPLLALSALFILLEKNAPASKSMLLALALIFGTAGDCFLLNAEKKINFNLGTISFLIGHFFYLAIFLPSAFSLPWFIFLITALLGIIFAVMTFFMLKKPKGLTGILCMLYSFIIVVLIFSGIAMLLAHKKEGIFVITGALIFAISDSVLSNTLFVKDFKNSRFVIMFTYIIAQMLLVWGVIYPFVKK